MSYKLDVKPAVLSYLRGKANLRRESRIKVWAFLHSVVAEVSDQMRLTPARRRGPNHFWLQFVFLEAGGIRTIDFYIDDSAAAFGALAVDYADCV